MWGQVVLSRIVHPRDCAAVVHGGARRGRCCRVSQTVVVSAGAAEELGAHVVIRSPVLGRDRGVADRPQAGVLTASENKEETCHSSFNGADWKRSSDLTVSKENRSSFCRHCKNKIQGVVINSKTR